MGTPILRGRAITTVDHERAAPVVVISQRMADTYWPGGGAVGHCLVLRQDPRRRCAQIVGIAADAFRSALTEEPSMHMYVPLAQAEPFGAPLLLVRSTNSARLAGLIRATLLSLDPGIDSVSITPLNQGVIGRTTLPWRTGLMVLGLGGLLTVVVAAAGIFSVMSYLVVQRSHEMAVRIALGAPRVHIFALVALASATPALVGLAIGLGVALAAGPSFEPMLFNTPGRDPLVLSMVGVILTVIVAVSTVGPAVAAAGTSAVQALRSD
jgi:hypothetical protein